MSLLGKLVRLRSDERHLLVRAVLLVWLVRLGLWLLPFQRLREVLGMAAVPAGGGQGGVPAPERVAWAVSVASRAVPAATCLTQALALQVLLVRRGHPARLRIGVARGVRAGQELQAHAWVESRGRAWLGGPEVQRFIPLVSATACAGEASAPAAAVDAPVGVTERLAASPKYDRGLLVR